ncbi:MAG: GMC family oxidoreductase N-terminal domain-containing protein [Rubrivivax sp.]
MPPTPTASPPVPAAEPAFDHVIVGAGTAGCLLANRLSEDPRCRVLLLEAGGEDNYPWIHIPVGYLYCIGNPRTDWLFFTEPDAGLNGRRLRYPRGKVLGGCSSINGMIYMRGQSRDYDHWAEVTGDPSWRWDAVLSHFTRHEDHWRAGESDFAPWHGSGGEWRVERQRLSWPILDAFAAAAREAGLPATEDFNRGNNEGVGYFEVNQKRGVRWNASKGFLRPVRRRRNLVVRTGAHVTRLLLERGRDGLRAVGVALRSGGKGGAGAPEETVRVAGEVILAAGAVATPQILQLSGVGPAALLAAHGIALAHELPGVGENLQDHLQIRAVFAVKGTRTLNTIAHSWLGKAGIGLQYLLARSGPMSMSPSQLGAFARSSPELAFPDLEYHVQPLSLDAFGEPLHRDDAFTASVCNLNPRSRGHVRIRSADPADAPRIQANYLSAPEDRLVAAASLRLTRRIASMPALARFAPRELKPGPQFDSDEDLARLAGDIGTTIFHPVATCRMGRADDAMAVVDPKLRVRGVAGLRVADASVMPTITSGNTNAPTLMIAERAAQFVREDRSR